MTASRLMLAAASGALFIGMMAAAPLQADAAALFNGRILLAADDAPPGDSATDATSQGSAKMGEGTGKQSGDEGATPENDTQKVDQPPRRNETTTGQPSDQGAAGD